MVFEFDGSKWQCNRLTAPLGAVRNASLTPQALGCNNDHVIPAPACHARYEKAFGDLKRGAPFPSRVVVQCLSTKRRCHATGGSSSRLSCRSESASDNAIHGVSNVLVTSMSTPGWQNTDLGQFVKN